MNNSGITAERAVLAAIYQHGFAAYADCSDLIDGDCFTTTPGQMWYATISQYYESSENQDKKPDIPTLTSLAASLGYTYATQKENQDFIRAVANCGALIDNARQNAAKIKRLRLTQLYIAELDAARAELNNVTGEEPMAEILSKVENRVLEFGMRSAEGGDGPQKMGDGLGDYMKALMEQTAPPGISSGFPWFDEAIGGGFCPNGVELLVARAKCGKSLFSNAVAKNVARTGIPVLYVDTEMTKEEQMRRLVASTSLVPERTIKLGAFRDNEQQKAAMRTAVGNIAKYPYYHKYVGAMSTEEILGTIRRWMIKDVGLDGNGYVKPSLIIYDYIKLLSDGESQMQEHQSLGFITIGLKDLMGKYHGRCLALGQQNRAGLDKEDESSIAGSDRLTWFSTSTAILKWQSTEELAKFGNGEECTHKIIPVLSRHGGKWKYGDYINVRSNLECCLLEEAGGSWERSRDFENTGEVASFTGE